MQDWTTLGIMRRRERLWVGDGNFYWQWDLDANPEEGIIGDMDGGGASVTRKAPVRVVDNAVNSDSSTAAQLPNQTSWKVKDMDDILELMRFQMMQVAQERKKDRWDKAED